MMTEGTHQKTDTTAVPDLRHFDQKTHNCPFALHDVEILALLGFQRIPAVS
jgi:hypothetical protein